MEVKQNKDHQNGDESTVIFPSKLLAWCSLRANKVQISDLETNQDYVRFDGVRYYDKEEDRDSIQ